MSKKIALQEAVAAAAEKKIPMAGTGGTDVTYVQSMGCNVLSASGRCLLYDKRQSSSGI